MKKRLSKTSINGFINYGIVIAAFLLLQLLMAQDMISNTLKACWCRSAATLLWLSP